MEHALLRGEVDIQHDPIRAQSLSMVAGCVVAVVVVAGCAILAFLRPNAPVGDSAIVMSRESGALYVRVDGTLHPVPNLASARLVAGDATAPKIVTAASIDRERRGSFLGIPGAPGAIGEPLSHSESAWTICDDTTTMFIAGGADQLETAERDTTILVTARSAGAAATYLLYDGRRSEVDLRSPGVVWALRLAGVEPRPVSRALLDAIPEAPPIVAPLIPGAGGPGAVPGLAIGTVVRVTGTTDDDFFVVLADGVQRVGEVAANLIRSLSSQGGQQIRAIAPDLLVSVPTVDPLPVSTYPKRAVMPLGARDGGALCAAWLPDGPKTIVYARDSTSEPVATVALAQSDSEGPKIDSVALPAGRSGYVRAGSMSRQGDESGPLYLLTDSGVLFGIRDEETARMLGLSGDPVAAPWPLLAGLPRGPELSRDAALVARDGIVSPP